MKIEWNPPKESPPKIDCQYNRFLSVRKDVTSLVNSRMRLMASRPLTEDERDIYNRFDSNNYRFGSDQKYGSTGEFAEDLAGDFPNGGMWEVSNVEETGVYRIEQDTKPSDVGYSIVFKNCPWDIFIRYWRKPVRLKSKLRYRRYYKNKKGLGMSNKTRNKNIEILSFAQNLNDWVKGSRPAAKMLNNQIILADFGYAFTKRTRNKIDQEIADWMMDNAPSFKLITDESTPFCDAMAEFCFTSDILGKYQDVIDN